MDSCGIAASPGVIQVGVILFQTDYQSVGRGGVCRSKCRHQARTINRTRWGMSDVLLLLGNALVLLGILDPPLDDLLFVHNAPAANYLPGNAITVPTPEKEMCRRREHKRGVRRMTAYAHAECKYEVEMSASV